MTARTWPFQRTLLIACTLAACWLGMMCVHELGHVINAFLSGGQVIRVVLNPMEFSRTDVSPNPHPAFVAWGGVVWGSALPAGLWILTRRCGFAFLLRFFAGFCLVANGAYLASAVLLRVGDMEELIRQGVPSWLLGLSGLPLVVAGLCPWHRLGPSFGSGGRTVNRSAVVAAAIALVFLLAAMLVWSFMTS